MTTYPMAGAYAQPAYPARFGFEAPERIANWRPLVHWLLAIPHLLVVEALQGVAQVLAVISWFAILFTGRLPAGIARFQAMYVRYTIRTATYTGFLREEYPPFTLDTTTTDPGDDPRVQVDVDPQIEDRNRLTTGFRLVLVIPHAIALALLAIALAVVAIIGFFAVLFTGRWPRRCVPSPSVSAGGGCGCRPTCSSSPTTTRRSPSTSARCPHTDTARPASLAERLIATSWP